MNTHIIIGCHSAIGYDYVHKSHSLNMKLKHNAIQKQVLDVIHVGNTFYYHSNMKSKRLTSTRNSS